jgi:hypothetical protein
MAGVSDSRSCVDAAASSSPGSMKAAVLAPAGPLNTLLRSRAAAEVREIARVKKTLTRRVALVPFQAEEPVGAPRLMELTKGGPTSAGSGPVSGGHRALAS